MRASTQTSLAADDGIYRRLIREVVSRNPRMPCSGGRQTAAFQKIGLAGFLPKAATEPIVIPGYANLREFSTAREPLLKAECGGAWHSYVLRSHWRMIFPISRAHQERTAARLLPALRRNFSPIIHLVRFPSLTINHGMILFDAAETAHRRGVFRLRPERSSPTGAVDVRPRDQNIFPAAKPLLGRGRTECHRNLPELVYVEPPLRKTFKSLDGSPQILC